MKDSRFGRWGVDDKASKLRIITQGSPKNEIESVQHGNALAATGNYPIGTDGCFNVGISGGCGPDCYVYQAGDCTEPDEIE